MAVVESKGAEGSGNQWIRRCREEKGKPTTRPSMSQTHTCAGGNRISPHRKGRLSPRPAPPVGGPGIEDGRQTMGWSQSCCQPPANSTRLGRLYDGCVRVNMEGKGRQCRDQPTGGDDEESGGNDATKLSCGASPLASKRSWKWASGGSCR